MLKAFKDMSGSKKAIVFVLTAILMAAVIFGGIETEAANHFTDKLYKLAMAYLGGQGLADLGKYAGEAYKAGKGAVETRDKDKLDGDELVDRLKSLEDLDPDTVRRIQKIFDAASNTINETLDRDAGIEPDEDEAEDDKKDA